MSVVRAKDEIRGYAGAESVARRLLWSKRERVVGVERVYALINESAYRRGFQHGVCAAVDALQEGATKEDIDAYASRRLHNWRYSRGKYDCYKVRSVSPPHWTGKGSW